MTLPRPASRLTIVAGESDPWHHRPLSSEIVHRAHAAGLAGGSVPGVSEGCGAGSRVCTSRLPSLSQDPSVTVVIVAAEDRIEAFWPQLDELLQQGLAVVEPVTILTSEGRT